MQQSLASLIAQYGLLVVALNVLVDQIGLPVPAMPTLIVAGAMAAAGHLSIGPCVRLVRGGLRGAGLPVVSRRQGRTGSAC